MNLFKETLEKLASVSLSPRSVKFVGTRDAWMTWDEFVAVSADVEYDRGYGRQEIRDDLVVVGDNWWFERAEYDGAEWWEFKRLPVRPSTHAISPVLDREALDDEFLGEDDTEC